MSISRVPRLSVRSSNSSSSKLLSTRFRSNVDDTQIMTGSPKVNTQASNRKSFFSSLSGKCFASTPTHTRRYDYVDSLNKQFRNDVFGNHLCYIPSEEDRKKDPQLNLELLRTMTPKNTILYLENNPVFLSAMSISGYLKVDIVSSVSLTLTPAELQRFMTNITNETNYFTAINSCTTFGEVEDRIPKIMNIDKCIYWSVTPDNNFIFSERNNFVIPSSKSIIGRIAISGEDICCNNVYEEKEYNSSYDKQVFSEFKSTVILPLRNRKSRICGLLQCIGYKKNNNNEESHFSKYFFEVLKIIRDLTQRNILVDRPQIMPNTISLNFKGIDNKSLDFTYQQVNSFLRNTFCCKSSDVYYVNARTKTLLRFRDQKVFNEETGGVSFQAAFSKEPIFIPQGFHDYYSFVNKDIDDDEPILSTSVYISLSQYVVTLYGKQSSPCFNESDAQLLIQVAPIAICALKVAQWSQNQTNIENENESSLRLYRVECEALSDIAEKGMEPRSVLENAAKKIFGAEGFAIALFDGRNMVFSPGGAKIKFEDCTAGNVYSYRDCLETKKGENGFVEEAYKSFEFEVQRILSFPYRINGRVAGAIEMLNPSETPTPECYNVFSDLCSILDAR